MPNCHLIFCLLNYPLSFIPYPLDFHLHTSANSQPCVVKKAIYNTVSSLATNLFRLHIHYRLQLTEMTAPRQLGYFIRAATGHDDAKIGDGLQSCKSFLRGLLTSLLSGP
jgi:hypothetical protein